MTRQVSALLTTSKHWHFIQWDQCYKTVARLPARIVKATEAEQKGKVKALQWLLTHAYSGRAIAVKGVTANRGKKPPGVKGVKWSTPQEKLEAIGKLRRSGYCPQPVRRIDLPKVKGKSSRALGMPTMHDRAIQALHLLALDPIAETRADPTSYGFRIHQQQADAIANCFRVLSWRIAPKWILEEDIASCFDRIGHRWLLEPHTGGLHLEQPRCLELCWQLLKVHSQGLYSAMIRW